jgi:hypothetical protein
MFLSGMKWKHLINRIRIRLPEKSLPMLQLYKKLAQKKHRTFKIDPESFIFPYFETKKHELTS